MRGLLLIAVLLIGFIPGAGAQVGGRLYPRIEVLNLRDAPIKDAVRLLSSITGAKIIATRSTEGVTADLFVRNADVTESLKLLCRSTGLVYRFDEESGIFTVMTLEEYRQNVQVDTDGMFKVRVFQVEPANVTQIARAIENLFPDQVVFTEGEDIENFSGQPGTTGDSGGSFGSTGSGVSTSDNDRSVGTSEGSSFGVAAGSVGLRSGRSSAVTGEAALSLEGERTRTPGARLQPGAAASEPTIFVTTSLEHNGIVVRTANLTALRQIEDLVVQLDKPVPQVILEMKILELAVGDGRNVGVEFGKQSGSEVYGVSDRDPQTGAPAEIEFLGRQSQVAVNLATDAAAGFVYQYLSRDITARVQLLATANNVEVVATPLLIAANNRAARIEVGEQRIITVGASTDTSVAGETGTRNEFVRLETERRTIGVTLQIRPRINEDGTVTLYVEQESTTLKPGNNKLLVGRQEVPIDSVDTANISATVVAKNGNTVAVGGLIRNEDSANRQKIPLLGDIPYVGRVFGSENISRRKSELVLLITPKIISPKLSNKHTDILMDRLSDHSYHAAGSDLIEQRNAQLQRFRDERDAQLARVEEDFVREQQVMRQQTVARKELKPAPTATPAARRFFWQRKHPTPAPGK